MNRSEHAKEAIATFIPPGMKNGDRFDHSHLELHMDLLVQFANDDREAFIEDAEERGEKVPFSMRPPITANEIRRAAEPYDYWIVLNA